jgi:hypothetical protein
MMTNEKHFIQTKGYRVITTGRDEHYDVSRRETALIWQMDGWGWMLFSSGFKE